MDKQILTKIAEHPWAILPSALESAVANMEAGLPAEAAARRAPSRAGAIAVLPLQGVLRQKGSTFMDELFGDGGASTERFAANIRRLAADDSIGTIVLDVHSPGGEVFGTAEAADAVFEARSSKKIVAVVNSMAASAAYWIASQAHEIIATPSSLTGSIGVFAVHEDISQMAERIGVKITLISAGKFKTEGNEFEPLTDEAKAAIQHIVDEHYGQFVAAVARGRKVSQSAVRAGYGQGRVLTANDAVKAGLVDRIGTLRDVMGQAGGAEGAQAMAEIEGDGSGERLPEFSAEERETYDGEAENEIERERWQWIGVAS